MLSSLSFSTNLGICFTFFSTESRPLKEDSMMLVVISDFRSRGWRSSLWTVRSRSPPSSRDLAALAFMPVSH